MESGPRTIRKLSIELQLPQQSRSPVAAQRSPKEFVRAHPALAKTPLALHALPKNPIDLLRDGNWLNRIMPKHRNSSPAPLTAGGQHFIRDRLGILFRIAGGGFQTSVHDRKRKFQELVGFLVLKVVRRKCKARSIAKSNPVGKSQGRIECKLCAIHRLE